MCFYFKFTSNYEKSVASKAFLKIYYRYLIFIKLVQSSPESVVKYRQEAGMMSSISANTEYSIEFADEEKEILKKAGEILNKIAYELWHTGSGTDIEDEMSFFFSGISGSIENILKGIYERP